MIFPTDLDIPTPFATYMPWKQDVVTRTAPFQGGREKAVLESINPIRNTRYTTSRKVNRNSKRSVTRKQMQKNLNVLYNLGVYMQNAPNNSTMQAVQNNSTQQNNLTMPALENISTNLFTNTTSSRFTDPIGSFKGKAATPRELEMAKKMLKFFENNPI